MKKILVIDDSIPIQFLCRTVLQKNSFDVKTAGDVYESINILKEFLPDLILLDIKLPSSDGIEFAKKIQRIKKLKKIPIILLTGNSDYDTVKRAKEINPAGYIIKPINSTILLQKVNEVIFFKKEKPVKKAKIKKSKNVKKSYSAKNKILTFQTKTSVLNAQDIETIKILTDEYTKKGITGIVLNLKNVNTAENKLFSDLLKFQESKRSEHKPVLLIFDNEKIITELKEKNIFKYFNIEKDVKTAKKKIISAVFEEKAQ